MRALLMEHGRENERNLLSDARDIRILAGIPVGRSAAAANGTGFRKEKAARRRASGAGRDSRPPMTRVLAISSTGGHWVQLLRLLPAFDGCEVHFATSTNDFREDARKLSEARGQKFGGYHVFTDANRWQKLRLLKQLLEVAMILLKARPDVIVTTGASVGYFALRLGRMRRIRTCWVDSIANAEELSLSGKLAGPYADLYLTQWPDLARPGGPHHRGAVL